jgi:hypothetical protein
MMESSFGFLLYVLGPLYEPHAAHDVISIFHAEDFPNLLWYGDSSARYYLSEEGNVFFLNLNRQLLASGKWLRTQ